MRNILLAALLLCPATAEAASFERFDAPGATTTCGTAIASNGLVAGTAYVGTIVVGDAARTQPPRLGAFLYRSGHFSFPKPAALAGTLTFTGVNRSAAIVGLDFDSAAIVTQSFLYADHATSFPMITGASSISLAGLTDSGMLLGQAGLSGGAFDFRYVGFLKTAGGAVTLIDDGSDTTNPAGVDETGNYVVGTSLNQNGNGWIYHAGVFTPISFPGAVFTSPRSVTSKAAVSGNYLAENGSTLTTHGFRFKAGAYTRFDLPGADATSIGGMNEAGQITGCFTKGGHTHGFLYTP